MVANQAAFAVSLEIAQRTDPGLDPDKQQNEDAAVHGPTPLGHLLVVCDGMGGHELGREASQLATLTVLQIMQSTPAAAPPGAALAQAIVQAGRAVHRLGGPSPNPARPGSTIVAMLVRGPVADVAHVGDSRGYLVRRGQAWQLTKDHSVVQQLVERGMVAPEQAASHPEANKITRALGMKPETDVELRDPPIPCGPDDIFVLATDGLCDLVTGDEIGAVIGRAATLEAACDELVALANARGGHDNITVQIARVRSGASGGMNAGAGAPGGAATTAPTVVMGEPAPPPTLVEEGSSAPSKTIVDAVRATAPGPMAPGAHDPAGQAPLPFPGLASPGRHPGVFGREPPTHVGLPSRAGWLALIVGFVGVALVLGGVMLWLILRGSR